MSLSNPKGFMPSDPFLDWDYERQSMMEVATEMLERRLRYWKEKEQEELLRRYRLINSI